MPANPNRLLTRLLCLVAGVCLAVPFVAGAQQHRTGVKRGERHEFRNQIFQLEDAMREALLRRNVPAVDKLLSDDYIGIMANGMIESKEQTLANLRDGSMQLKTIVVSDRKVRFYGTTALVTSRAEISGSSAEGDMSGAYRYTRVYARDEHGAWKIVHFEASRISDLPGGQ